MTPVQPEELSALIDGELGPERAAEIERRMAEDPALRAAFDALRDLDGQWKAAAATAVFMPTLARPAADPRHGAAAVGSAAALAGLWVMGRAVDAVDVVFAAQAVVLAGLLAGLILIVRADLRGAGEPST